MQQLRQETEKQPDFLGKIIIVKPGRGGKCASLTDEDIEHIRENIGVPTKVYNYFSKICICGGQTLRHDY